MARYYGIVRSEQYLKHYGIKGMRWGVRRAIENARRQYLYRSVRHKLNKLKKQGPIADSAKRTKQMQKINSRIDILKNDTTGKWGQGNINLNKRKVVRNSDGSISTERSFSINSNGKEVLIPQVVNGRVLSYDDAEKYYTRTGQHLGKFNSIKEANEYARKLHNRQDWYYKRRKDRNIRIRRTK